MEDDGKELTKPGSVNTSSNKEDIATLVNLDFTEYRKKVDN